MGQLLLARAFQPVWPAPALAPLLTPLFPSRPASIPSSTSAQSIDGAVTDTMLQAALDRDDEPVLKFVTGLAERGHLIRTMPVVKTHRRNTSTPSPAKQALWNTVATGGKLSLREMALAILES